jgi:hypothetical protein
MADKAQRPQGTNNEEIMQALNVLFENFTGAEFKAMRSSIDSLTQTLAHQIEIIKKENIMAVNELRKDVYSRLDSLAKSLEEVKQENNETISRVDNRLSKSMEELKKSQAEAAAAVEKNVLKPVTELKSDLAKTGDSLRSNLASAKSSFEAVLSNLDQAIRGELDLIKSSVSANAGDLVAVRAEVKRASTALANMARVFSGHAVAENPAAQEPVVAEKQPEHRQSSVPEHEGEPAVNRNKRGDASGYALPESHDVLQHLDRIFKLDQE